MHPLVIQCTADGQLCFEKTDNRQECPHRNLPLRLYSPNPATDLWRHLRWAIWRLRSNQKRQSRRHYSRGAHQTGLRHPPGSKTGIGSRDPNRQFQPKRSPEHLGRIMGLYFGSNHTIHLRPNPSSHLHLHC